MDEKAILRRLRTQSGVVSRDQVLEHGGSDIDIERLLRQRVWSSVHRGVYVDHTGPLTWDQRAWAAVLLHAPAVLSGRSAMRAHRMRVLPAIAPDSEPIEIAVAATRRVGPTRGIRIRRVTNLTAISTSTSRPPRLHVEHAVLLAASGSPREDTAVAVLSDACQEGRTTADRLARALALHPRLPGRRLLGEILADVDDGAFSALERRYLRDVERAHGLPRADRQSRASGVVRDVRYRDQRVIVELDGRLAHDRTEQRWADLDRDLASAASGDVTIRVTWGQVLAPCRLATAIGRVLVHRGWREHPSACGDTCPVTNIGGSPAPGAGDPPMSTR